MSILCNFMNVLRRNIKISKNLGLSTVSLYFYKGHEFKECSFEVLGTQHVLIGNCKGRLNRSPHAVS